MDAQLKINSAESNIGPGLFFRDVLAGVSARDVWMAFALDEMRARYRRSVLGLLWIIVSYAIFVVGISLFFGSFAEMGGGKFTLYVAIGYAVFLLLISNVVDGCMVFSNSAVWIKSTSLPYSVYIYQSIFRSVLPFTLQMTIIVALMIALKVQLQWTVLLVFPALGLFLLTVIPAQYLLGFISARFRDLQHLVDSITRILIFMTPILWVLEEREGVTALLGNINPLTHYVEIFRAPLMGADIRWISWLVVLGMIVCLWLAAMIAMMRMRRRLPFWI